MTIAPRLGFVDREQPELWMPTGGNPACAYERAVASAVRGTGASPEYRCLVVHGGLVYALLLEVPVPGLYLSATYAADHLGRSSHSSYRLMTAAVAPSTILPQKGPASAPAVTSATSSAPADDVTTAITAAEQIDGIQDTLSLGISHIAEIVCVARGTVHGWVRGDTPIPRDPRVAQRLRDLHQVGAQWRRHSEQEIGRLLVAPLGDGEPSLFDLLRADQWDHRRLERALLLLADRVEERRSRPPREELQKGPETSGEVQRHELRTLVQRGRFYGR